MLRPISLLSAPRGPQSFFFISSHTFSNRIYPIFSISPTLLTRCYLFSLICCSAVVSLPLPLSGSIMAPGHKPNPFAKVTEETSEPEHERRLVRAKAMIERKRAAVKAAANKAPSPSTSNPATKAKISPTAKPLAPLRKKRSGLRGVALTFSHYGVKKVVRRPSALLMQSAKVPPVPPLPGQEGKYILILFTLHLLIYVLCRCTAI